MDASPLAKLPPELRNMVYHGVLYQEDPILLVPDQWYGKQEILEGRMNVPTLPRPPSKVCDVASRGRLKDYECVSNRMAVTATCKPLRQETRDLFFAINTFEIGVPRFGEASPRRTCKDTADELLGCFLELLSTRSAISAVKSIILNLGLMDFRPEDSTRLRDMVTVLIDEPLRGSLDLPIKVRADFGLEEIGGPFDVYIDMRNLASSIEVELEQVEEWRQHELEYWSSPDDRTKCQEVFDTINSRLKACLQSDAATEEV
ncbi:hypothetical protein KC318_g3379 [Hortaea werneckii]|nr:hypothetical protein KC334_g6355 [Hortaea werneckii]KAI7018846.1 hypothetical protein KC355_g3229 [Hortaea werneckii]KAI7169262.1 hypothetical protein KC324_g11367 [Hortaea werneckii]KAI7567566.1 hypothetical protein KC316_g12410 [Hortaea werneckii]KAI7671646.1 hypothetical protein KC318_g3379 [Hortaea werneckii]